jgi:hypothetical protein
LQLLFFQSLHLKQIRAGRILECRNRGVEVAMRLVQPRQLGPQLVFFLLSHALWVAWVIAASVGPLVGHW